MKMINLTIFYLTNRNRELFRGLSHGKGVLGGNMKNPFMLRKKHLTEIKALNSDRSSLTFRINRLEEDLLTANNIITEILPRLVRLKKPVENREFQTYRICVEFHRDMVERAFTHGGDEPQIEYFAELLGCEIKRKMMQFNFARCD